MLRAIVEMAFCVHGKGYTGYISSQIIKDHVKAPSENVKIYICGKH
jgi:NAD(P)H-flavin reductase